MQCMQVLHIHNAFLKKQIEASKLKMDRKMSLILFSCASFHILVEPSEFFFSRI